MICSTPLMCGLLRIYEKLHRGTTTDIELDGGRENRPNAVNYRIRKSPAIAINKHKPGVV